MASPTASFARIVLLCVDDDPDVLECERAFLETFGYTVLTASSGREGLEIVAHAAIDVVIVDYYMPEMDGREFACAVRELRPNAPIIMLSGAVDVPEYVLVHVNIFVPKDCLASELLPAITQLRGHESLSSISAVTQEISN